MTLRNSSFSFYRSYRSPTYWNSPEMLWNRSNGGIILYRSFVDTLTNVLAENFDSIRGEKKNAEALRMEVETLVNMASTKNKNCHKKKLGAKKSWSWTYFHRFLSIFHIRPITHTVPFECMIKMKWQYGKSKSNKMHGSNWRNKIKTE